MDVPFCDRFYKGLVPLWSRQIPYTMMKFACFERTVEFLYKYVVPKPRADCTKAEQLVVTFMAGYIGNYSPFYLCDKPALDHVCCMYSWY